MKKLNLFWRITISLLLMFFGIFGCNKSNQLKNEVDAERVGIEFSDFYKSLNSGKSGRIYYYFNTKEDFGDVKKLFLLTPIDSLELTVYSDFTVNDSLIVGGHFYNTAFSFWDFPGLNDNLYFFYTSNKLRIQNSSLLIKYRDTSLIVSNVPTTTYHYYLNNEEIQFPRDIEKLKGYYNDLYKNVFSESNQY